LNPPGFNSKKHITLSSSVPCSCASDWIAGIEVGVKEQVEKGAGGGGVGDPGSSRFPGSDRHRSGPATGDRLREMTPD
jgi:hypothetical protein